MVEHQAESQIEKLVRLYIFGRTKKKPEEINIGAINAAYTAAENAFDAWLTERAEKEADSDAKMTALKADDHLVQNVQIISPVLRVAYLRPLYNEINLLAAKPNIDPELKEALTEALTTLTEALKPELTREKCDALEKASSKLSQKNAWNAHTIGICTALGAVAGALVDVALIKTVITGFGIGTTVLPIVGIALSLALLGWIAWKVSQTENQEEITSISSKLWRPSYALGGG